MRAILTFLKVLWSGELIEIQNTGVAPNLKHNFVQ